MRTLRPVILPDNKKLVVFPLPVELAVAGAGLAPGNPVVKYLMTRNEAQALAHLEYGAPQRWYYIFVSAETQRCRILCSYLITSDLSPSGQPA